MKKILACLLAVLMLASLAACKSEGNKTAAPAPGGTLGRNDVSLNDNPEQEPAPSGNVVDPVPQNTNAPVPSESNAPVPSESNAPVPSESNAPVPSESNTPAENPAGSGLTEQALLGSWRFSLTVDEDVFNTIAPAIEASMLESLGTADSEMSDEDLRKISGYMTESLRKAGPLKIDGVMTFSADHTYVTVPEPDTVENLKTWMISFMRNFMTPVLVMSLEKEAAAAGMTVEEALEQSGFSSVDQLSEMFVGMLEQQLLDDDTSFLNIDDAEPQPYRIVDGKVQLRNNGEDSDNDESYSVIEMRGGDLYMVSVENMDYDDMPFDVQAIIDELLPIRLTRVS